MHSNYILGGKTQYAGSETQMQNRHLISAAKSTESEYLTIYLLSGFPFNVLAVVDGPHALYCLHYGMKKLFRDTA